MLRLAVIPIALLALVAGAVVWSNTGQGPPADFSFINRGENKTLDLGVMSWSQDVRIAYQLWEGLYTPDPVTFKPIPGSADRIELSPDKTVYTFHIRPTARWCNGDTLKSTDFVFAWRRMLRQPGEYTYLFFYIKGAKEYQDAYAAWKSQMDQGKKAPEPSFDKMVGVQAPDAHTLIVRLAHPVPYFTSICAFPSYFPQYEPCMKAFAQWDAKHTYITGYDQAFTRPPHLVGNGPYRLAEWSFKRRLRLIASDYYWNRAKTQSRIIDQLFADDGLAQFRAYESGYTDWLPDVDGDMAADLLARHRSDLHVFPAFGTYFYDFNCRPTLSDGSKNPFHDPRVRRAFSMAVDREPIVRNVTRSGEPPANTYIPRGAFPDYPSPAGLPYDVAAARKLLAEAGYPGGAGFPHVPILFNNDFPVHGEIAQVVRRQWQANLGVDLSLEGLELKVFGERLHQHDFAVARASWYGDYYDPSTFTDVLKSSSENNDSDWRNPQYDALLVKAEFEGDPQKRMKILAQAENMILQQAPILPLYQYVNHYLFRSNVHGIALDPRMMIMMQVVKVDRTR